MQYLIRYKNENGLSVWDTIKGESAAEIRDNLLDNGVLPDILLPAPFSLKKYKANAGLSDKQCKDIFFQLANLINSSGNISTAVNFLHDKINAINQDKFVHRSKIRRVIKKFIKYYYNDKFKYLIKFIDSLKDRVHKGDNLIGIFSDNKFDEVAISLLKSAERTGDLYNGFMKCMQYYESKIGYKKAILDTLLYPALLFSLLYIAFLTFLFYVIPSFASFFKEFPHVPPSTLAIINLFALLRKYSIFYTGAFIAGCILLFYFFVLNKYNLRTKIFNGLASIPIVGELFQFEFLRYFMYQLSLLISSGADIRGIISFFKDNTKNSFYKDKLVVIHNHLMSGYGLAKSFEIASFLRVEDIYFIDSAEKSGSLDKATMELSKTYSEYFDTEMKLFKNALSGIAVALVVIFILIIFAGVYLPMINGMVSLAK
ncbi:MAG: type II secretion system F family protein [Deltaproteobacteria bacterium]|nr:type II secretion system F family protein [Deltaproteobacteria bacterium]